MALVSQGNAIVQKVNPDAARPFILLPMAAGDGQGIANIVVFHPNMEAFGKQADALYGNEEYMQFLANWPQDKFTPAGTFVANTVMGPGGTLELKGGEVIFVRTFANGGGVRGLAEVVQKGMAIGAELNPDVRQGSLLVPVAGGSNQDLAITFVYENMAQLTEVAAKNAASEEFQAFIAEWPVDTYPLTFSAISRVVLVP